MRLLGEQTRPHDDLDFAVLRGDVERLPAVFPEFRRVHEDQWPGAYVLRDGSGRQLDFHPIELDERGDGWQTGLDGRRHCWPREALGARGRIAGRQVRCTSPEFQVQARVFPQRDDVDWADPRALAARFGLELPPELAGPPPGFAHEKRSFDTRGR